MKSHWSANGEMFPSVTLILASSKVSVPIGLIGMAFLCINARTCVLDFFVKCFLKLSYLMMHFFLLITYIDLLVAVQTVFPFLFIV